MDASLLLLLLLLLLLIFIQNRANNLPLLKRFNNNRRSGKNRFRKSYMLPRTKVIIQYIQMMRLDVQMRLCRHGMTELLDARPDVEPPQRGYGIHERPQTSHDAKISIDQFCYLRMAHFDGHDLRCRKGIAFIFINTGQPSLVHLSNRATGNRLHIERVKHLQQRSFGNFQRLLNLLLGVRPAVLRRIGVQMAQRRTQLFGKHIGSRGSPLAPFDKGRAAPCQALLDHVVPHTVAKCARDVG
mmetsp:Transcript_22204/g.33910  ORF Transcript_22204/g.33910 Transcript_22204/m.33910 type:complete len:242 (+) Transcript_22204:1274-1999(+)